MFGHIQSFALMPGHTELPALLRRVFKMVNWGITGRLIKTDTVGVFADSSLYDHTRLDHLIGFFTSYYAIEQGKTMPRAHSRPGLSCLMLLIQLGPLPFIIAEDLEQLSELQTGFPW